MQRILSVLALLLAGGVAASYAEHRFKCSLFEYILAAVKFVREKF